MRLSRNAVVLALGWPVLAMSATLTNSNIDTRTTTNVLSFSDLAFDNLDRARSDLLTFHGAVGSAGMFTINGPFAPDATVSVVPGSGMAVFDQAFVPATASISYIAEITGTTGLSMRQSWNTTRSASMTAGVSGGLHTLEVTGNNSGFLMAGGVFDYSVTLPGDWSTQGTSTGDAELLGLNPEFAITQDFVFDPATDTTTLEVLNTRYDLDHASVGLDFVLFGSAVSEPFTPAMLLAGAGALAWVSRRRRAR